MGILVSLMIHLRTVLIRRKTVPFEYGSFKFTLRMPSTGEFRDLSNASGANDLLPDTSEVIDGLIFYNTDEYLERALAKGKAIIPIFIEKSIEAEHKMVELVTGVSPAAQYKLPIGVYLRLLDRVESFTEAEIKSSTRDAKKNYGTWSSAGLGIVKKRTKRTTTRSSTRGTPNTKSATKEPAGTRE